MLQILSIITTSLRKMVASAKYCVKDQIFSLFQETANPTIIQKAQNALKKILHFALKDQNSQADQTLLFPK